MSLSDRAARLASLSAASCLAVAASPAQYLGRQQDDLLYIVASQSLAHGSYRLETAVGRPLMLTITPGWPLALLPVSLLAPARLGAYEAFAALLQAALPWAVYAWAKRRLDKPEALLCALLCAASPLLLSQAGAVMSETAFTLCALWLLCGAQGMRGRRTGAWAAAACQLRPAGLSLLPAAAAGFLRRRDWRGLAWAAGLPLAGYGAWAALSAWALRHARADAGKIAYEGRGWAAPFAAGGWEKLSFYARALGGGFLPRSWAAGHAPVVLGLLLMALALAGAARALQKRGDDPEALALLGTLAMYAAWAWQYERYWITALPLLWWAAASLLGGAARPVLSALLCLELAFGALPWLSGTSWRAPELSRTYAWLARAIPADEAVASAEYVRDGFLSGHPGTPLPDAPDAAAFAAQLRAQHVKYALWAEKLDIGVTRKESAYLQGKLERAGAQLRERSFFDIVYSDADEGSAVYRLR